MEDHEDQEEGSRNEKNLIPEPWVHGSKTAIEIVRDEVLQGRMAEMKDIMNHHLFDEFPASEAVGKKLILAKWRKYDRGEKARQRLVAMEIAAFEEKRDDIHAMTPPLKVARMLVS